MPRSIYTGKVQQKNDVGNLSCIVWKRAAKETIFPESLVSSTSNVRDNVDKRPIPRAFALTISSLIFSLGFNIYSIIFVTYSYTDRLLSAIAVPYFPSRAGLTLIISLSGAE